MLRLFMFIGLVSLNLGAKGLYRVGVCGNSRFVEELELALELESRVMVGSCSDKKLDARVTVQTDRVLSEISGVKSSWRRRDFSVAKLMGEFTRPKPVSSPPVSSPPVSSVIQIAASPEAPRNDELELFEQINEEPQSIHWGMDMAASLDQWNAGLSTKVYPGFQMQTKVEVAPLWYMGDRFAFGTSAFQIDDQVVWNQQVGNHLWASRQFEIAKGLRMGPALGYFLWGSFAGDAQIPQFQKHDVSVGGRMMWTSQKRAFELECAAAFLAVHLGVEGQLATRVYLASNWYAALQGYAVGTWGMGQTGSFLSASLGLGYAQ